MSLNEIYNYLNDIVSYIKQDRLFDMIKFPKEGFSETALTYSTQQFLESVGLPDWAAPHLHFGEFDEGEWLPRLKNWSWQNREIPEIISQKIVLGSQESPICFDLNEIIVIFDQENEYQKIYMNENVVSLLNSLTIFQKMILIEIDLKGRDVFRNKNICKALATECLQLIGTFDKDATKANSFWYREVVRISSNS